MPTGRLKLTFVPFCVFVCLFVCLFSEVTRTKKEAGELCLSFDRN